MNILLLFYLMFLEKRFLRLLFGFTIYCMLRIWGGSGTRSSNCMLLLIWGFRVSFCLSLVYTSVLDLLLVISDLFYFFSVIKFPCGQLLNGSTCC